jgi:DNA polymerase eta
VLGEFKLELNITIFDLCFNHAESKSSVCNWLSHISDDSNGEYDGDRALAVGAAIVEELRAAIFEKAGFRCSAGVAHNKVIV